MIKIKAKQNDLDRLYFLPISCEKTLNLFIDEKNFFLQTRYRFLKNIKRKDIKYLKIFYMSFFNY